MITSIGYTEGQAHLTFVELLYRAIRYPRQPPDPKRACDFTTARENRRKTLAAEPGKNIELPPPAGRLTFNCPQPKLPWNRLVWTGLKGSKRIRQDLPVSGFSGGVGPGRITLASGAQVTAPGGGGGAAPSKKQPGPQAVGRIATGLPQISLGPASGTMPGIAQSRKKLPGEP